MVVATSFVGHLTEAPMEALRDKLDKLRPAAKSHQSQRIAGRDSPKHVAVAAAMYEAVLREVRRRQSDPEQGLIEFIRYFWHVLEPATPFVEGWVMECLCAHLQAITRKETLFIGGDERLFNRFLANVPPGFSKSLTVNVFWPAHEWGPMNLPHLRYVAFSYAAELTERDNQKFRDLIMSPDYQELWGHVFKVVGDGKVRVTNDKTGFKFASSMGGVGTGERGDRVLCFAGQQPILTERGPISIQEIVERRMPIRVWSFNSALNRLELQPITGWHTNPGRPLLRVKTSSGASVTCTHDHEIFTERGRRVAALLAPGDRVLTASSWVGVAAQPVVRPQVQVEMLPNPARPDAGNCGDAHTKLGGKFASESIMPRRYFANHIRRRVRSAVSKRTVLLAVRNVIGARSVLQITKAWVSAVAVLMSHLAPIWERAKECLSHQLVAHSVFCFATHAHGDARVSPAWRPFKHLGFITNRMLPPHMSGTVSVIGQTTGSPEGAPQAANAPEVGYFIEFFGPNNRTPFFDTIVSVDLIQDVPCATYCLTVDANHSLACGGEQVIITANCDDVHKVKGNESDELRKSIVQWVREGMSNRLNNLRESVIVIIMQRLHEEDTSGAIMKFNGDEYCHLIIPMEYEANRHFSHYTGWNDGQDPRAVDGDLAWPERFATLELASFKRNQFLWAGQYQQTPTPRGGGIFKEDWWQTYEVPPSKIYEFEPIFVLASLDTAFKEKEENDYSALTVWSVYDHPKTGQRRIVLVDAWKKRLPLHGSHVQRQKDEDERAYLRRAAQKWGLCEWVDFTCNKRHVDRLVIEDSARGHDVNAEIRRVYGARNWGVALIPARGDKWSRAHAVVDLFVDDMIYAPGVWDNGVWTWRDFASEVINEMCAFPRGAHDDLVDSSVQALRHLRETNFAIRREEREFLEREMMMYQKPSTPLYPGAA